MVGWQNGMKNKKRAFSQKLFFYRFSIGINFFKVKKIVLGYWHKGQPFFADKQTKKYVL